MFIRFVIKTIDRRSGRRQGLFGAAIALRDSGRLSAADDDHLEALWDWFNKNLEKPTRLSVSSRPNRKPQAISWFKETASSHIEKMSEFQNILERYGYVVEQIKASRIGYILYEDEFQAAAYPFNDTPT
jgi:hypothetical protein